jgi:hypothetical protein
VVAVVAALQVVQHRLAVVLEVQQAQPTKVAAVVATRQQVQTTVAQAAAALFT